MLEFLYLKNLLKFIIKYFSGNAQLRAANKRGQKVVSMALPVGIELVMAADAMPVFLLRVGEYSSGTYLEAARIYKNLFGWNQLHLGVSLLRPILGNKFFLEIVNKLLANVYFTYEKYTEVAENEGAVIDGCFGMRVHLGSIWTNLKFIHGALGYGLRCNWLSKTFEEIAEKVPVTLLQIPTSSGNTITEDCVIESINQVLADLEKITGTTITSEKLRQQILLTNQVRESYSKVLDIWARERIPLAPLTFSYFLAMLHIGFSDLMSDPKFYNEVLQQLLKDFQKATKSGGYDVSSQPKFVLVNCIGGYEPKLPEIVDQLGGRLLLADVEVFRMLTPIEPSGDILRNYAKFLMQFESSWQDNQTLVGRYVSVAEKYGVNNILFNNTYGCKSITPSLRFFKERLQDSAMSVVDIGFQNIGDNLEQTKTRIGAVMEIIRENSG